MSSISLSDFPDSLKENKQIFPYFVRSLELENVNAVVSYYCKIYVLEHILNNKLHLQSPEIETFTVKLLDVTESIKNGDDESLYKVLNDKTLSLSIVLTFTYKLYNSCLEEIENYNGLNKGQLVKKMKAVLNFLAVMDIFCSEGETEVDLSKLSSKIADLTQLKNSNREKSKVVKYQLSRLLKDEIPIKENDQDLENELEKELEHLVDSSDALHLADDPKGASAGEEEDVSTKTELESENNTKSVENETAKLSPSAPEDGLPTEDADTPGLDLPGAPSVPPDLQSDEVKLPGAPKFLPDDDLSTINKTSTIKVFPPEKPVSSERHASETSKTQPHPPVRPSFAHDRTQHITKDNLKSIINKTETITQIQKHAKFAISALNYEDVATAKKEFLEALHQLSTIEGLEE